MVVGGIVVAVRKTRVIYEQRVKLNYSVKQIISKYSYQGIQSIVGHKLIVKTKKYFFFFKDTASSQFK